VLRPATGTKVRRWIEVQPSKITQARNAVLPAPWGGSGRFRGSIQGSRRHPQTADGRADTAVSATPSPTDTRRGTRRTPLANCFNPVIAAVTWIATFFY